MSQLFRVSAGCGVCFFVGAESPTEAIEKIVHCPAGRNFIKDPKGILARKATDAEFDRVQFEINRTGVVQELDTD